MPVSQPHRAGHAILHSVLAPWLDSLCCDLKVCSDLQCLRLQLQGLPMMWQSPEWLGLLSSKSNAGCRGAAMGSVSPVPRKHAVVRDGVYLIILPHQRLVIPASCHNLKKQSRAALCMDVGVDMR